jgi:hypothetical protein
MLSLKLALAVGLTATVLALVAVLSHSPVTVIGTNGIPANPGAEAITGGTSRCQGGGTVPAGTSAIRVSLSAALGPEVSVKVLSGSSVVTGGERDAGWGIDETVTVPVRRVAATIQGARVCWSVGPAVREIQANGASVQIPNGSVVVWLRMEYLRPGPTSWLSLAPAIARHIGLGHAPSGTWVAWLLVVLMLLATVLVSRLLLGGSDG